MSVAWGDVPGWIVAGSTAGAFVAAGLAARATFKTLRLTRDSVATAQDQADAARQQVSAAHEQLRLAREQVAHQREVADRERQDANRAYGEAARARLDLLAPRIWCRAKAGLVGYPMLTSAPRTVEGGRPPIDAFHIVATERTMDPADGDIFLIRLTIELHNFGDQPAEVYFQGAGLEPLDWPQPQGTPIILLPGESKEIGWLRYSGSRREYDELQRDGGAEPWTIVRLRFLARDLGSNVSDDYVLTLDLRYFTADGSRLVVNPEVPFPWKMTYAYPLPPRSYPRLEADTPAEVV
jgi:hypothetical protein